VERLGRCTNAELALEGGGVVHYLQSLLTAKSISEFVERNALGAKLLTKES
jgi:hypothetical protein